ncbi:ZIP family metal transporter [Mycoplasma buteonis]|uniref:ZIP family metal transporter n=1 Tax=Mycoplasma buteonis TaxID=171280 RepID=UPI000A021C43|nr:ZIP family metal transporter [Mycoplasma buteonis]
MGKFLSDLAQSLEYYTDTNTAKFLLVLIFLLLLLIIPVAISALFPIIKKSLNHRTKVYLYAFSTGFFIILATFGFLREALEQTSIGSSQNGFTAEKTYLYNILVVFCGLLGGLAFSFTLKFVISYRINKKLMKNKKLSIFVHDHSLEAGHHHVHQHPDHIFTNEDSVELAEDALTEKISGKLKIIALALLLTHRIPEGFLIGYNLSLFFVNQSQSQLTTLSLAYFISLVLHMIPEELVFYYRLREAGYGPWAALGVSTLMDFLFLPFMLIGIYAGHEIGSNLYAQGAMMAIIAGIFLFTSLVEFFPEFYHVNMEKKSWFITIVCLFVGVSFAVLVLSFHTHSHPQSPAASDILLSPIKTIKDTVSYLSTF